jgi:hypothetical protein
MAGDSGREAENKVEVDPAALAQQQRMQKATNNPALRNVLAQYQAGGMSLKDAMAAMPRSGPTGARPGDFNREQALKDAEGHQSIINARKRLGDATGAAAGGIGGAAAGGFAGGNGFLGPIGGLAGAAGGAIAGIFAGDNQKRAERDLQWEIDKYAYDREQEAKKAQEDWDNQAADATAQEHAFQEEMVFNPLTGTMMAGEQVRTDPVLSKLFAEGGLLSRAEAEEKDLASRGFSLQQEDHEAYGQTSGNLARMFGQQENDIAASLASRGLAAAPSGAAGQAFSGIAGNKYEQLARAQTDIAQKRMNTNMQRLNQTRSLMQGLGSDYGNQLSNQYNRNMAGIQARRGNLNATASQQQNQQRMQQGQANDAFEQRESTRTPNFGEVMANTGTQLLGGAAGGLGQAAGTAAGAAVLSDERLKTDIQDGQHEMEEMLDQLSPKSYAYKNPEHGQGPQVGIMAQDLEQSPLGQSMVTETGEGKAITPNLSTLLASQGMLHQRLKKLEGRG